MRKLSKKGAIGINAVLPFISVIVVAAILIGVSQIVLDKFMQQSSNEDANSSINKSIVALGEFADWWDIMVIVLAAAVILGLIFMALYIRGGGGV